MQTRPQDTALPPEEHWHARMRVKELRQHIQVVNRHHASYYKHCTDLNWGDRANDDLCINTGTESVKDRPSPGAVYEAWR